MKQSALADSATLQEEGFRQTDVVSLLMIKQFVDANALLHACRDGCNDAALMQYMLENQSDPNAEATVAEPSSLQGVAANALHFACYLGLSETCDFLLGCNGFKLVNSKTRGDEVNKPLADSTALMLAIDEGHVDVCHALLSNERFTEVNASRETSGPYPADTAFSRAVSRGLPSVCRAILNHPLFDPIMLNRRIGYDFSLLSIVAGAGLNHQRENQHHDADLEIAAMILADTRFALVNEVGDYGPPWLTGNALHHAARTNHVGVAKAILGHQDFTTESVNVQNVENMTPLQVAESLGHREICGLIRARLACSACQAYTYYPGFNVAHTDCETSLHFAHGHQRMLFT
eukprot:TRINITY_DN40332_c0_g1_i1.p1 TRINITY_DN40332_c0_g1~~TRINITY_DN40332_c0_g1_i1.p1  ORF type:complete len:361 (-),score=53.12 TRINITY_DN40332_c0_g1_i1:161-1201(-)